MLHSKLYIVVASFLISTTLIATETIIFIRHAEKPPSGLGQLSCKGLHRSLSLPDVIIKKFGIPDYLIAPNPTVQKEDRGISYNYLRPLATIEPLAIKISKNIDLTCGFDDVTCIASLLCNNAYKDKTLLVAWEHHKIDEIVKKIADSKGIKLTIPQWNNDDFDTIYVLQIDKDSVYFNTQQEDLNNQKEDCTF